MALALRLTVLIYAVARADARWFYTRPDAGDWAPVTPTAEFATLNPERWEPATTPGPGRPTSPLELRRRDESGMSAICGYSDDSLGSPAVSCGVGEFCRPDRQYAVVGCCSAANPRGCIVPTMCLDSTQSTRWSTADPLTTYCGDRDRPRCVTRTYDANFFDSLYGASFVGCAAIAETGNIVASLAAASSGGASSTGSLSTFTSTNGVLTTTVTVNVPDSSASPTRVPPHANGGRSSSVSPGVIAGSVVGGVAGLALIIGAVLFFLYRRKKRAEDPTPLGLSRKMPPSDRDIYRNEVPGSQYASTFFGEAPPGMAQTTDQPIMRYPAEPYGTANAMFAPSHDRSAEAPIYFTPGAPLTKAREEVSPVDSSPVSPVSPAEHYNTMVSALSNDSPPLQPLQPAVRHHQRQQQAQPPQQAQQPQQMQQMQQHRQSVYAQFSPPPPEHYQSYRPYPGT
ncbi:hypothetical protein F5Y17DRAFT_473445 [Xylariaceae sp. FL0594]|nr:hypothetical protein F5Y17DRAFT_473445 [Xylariaceae sp. FL0594]